MTEKERMLAGQTYDCGDPALLARWHEAKKLQKQYNDTASTDKDRLHAILRELIGGHGANVWISSPFFVDYGENIFLGNNVEINMNCVFLDCNRIAIGDNSGIGPGVHIYTVDHPIQASERVVSGNESDFPFWKSVAKAVNIGKNVWIGGGSIILSGVNIGDNTTIGAGSVVTKDIPANCLAFGNPCQIVKYL